MGDDKIRITRGDVHSADVDARLKRQEALNRTQRHVEERGPATSPPNPGTSQVTSNSGWSLFYNPLVFMTLFGLGGGLFAWMFGEFPMSGLHDRDFDQYVKYSRDEDKINRQRKNETLSQEAYDKAITGLQDQYKRNTYVALRRDYVVVWRKYRQDPQRETAHEEERARTRFEETLAKAGTRYEKKQPVEQFLFYTLVGTFLALFLSLAEPTVCRNVNRAVISAAIGAMLGLCGGIIVWLPIFDQMYHAMGGGNFESSFARQMAARAVIWAICGTFLALAPGIVLRSYKRCAIGLAGGLVGGLLGGLLFDPVVYLTKSDVFSRFVLFCAIGGFIGAGTGILENAAKTGWLLVTAGLIAGKQFVIYRNPTVIGSSPQCEVFLFKDAGVRPRHAQISVLPSGFELENLMSDTGTIVNGRAVNRVRLRDGDQIQIGSTCFAFHEKVKTA